MVLKQTPKYSKLEVEKKWLIDPEKLTDISVLDKIEIVDKYFPETRMRLRKMTHQQNGKKVFKFCKKYGKQSSISEPITNIYLEESEYFLLNTLPGNILKKNRYSFHFKDKSFSIDELLEPQENLYLLELELHEEKDFTDVELPDFIVREVTTEEEFSGYYIAKSKG